MPTAKRLYESFGKQPYVCGSTDSVKNTSFGRRNRLRIDDFHVFWDFRKLDNFRRHPYSGTTPAPVKLQTSSFAWTNLRVFVSRLQPQICGQNRQNPSKIKMFMKNVIFGARMKLRFGVLRMPGFRSVGKQVWNKLNVDSCIDIHWFSSFFLFSSFSSFFLFLYCKKEENEVFLKT